jgi:hypothetical protein
MAVVTGVKKMVVGPLTTGVLNSRYCSQERFLIVTSRQWMVRRWWWLVKQPNTSPFQVSEVNDWKEVAA